LTKVPKKAATATTSATASTSGSTSTSSAVAEDVLSAADAKQFNDENDGVIVTKRDPESAHPVRAASMDYFVPEKVRNIIVINAYHGTVYHVMLDTIPVCPGSCCSMQYICAIE
jgi:hypothetical protein